MKRATLDFETEPIVSRPGYPPKPGGLGFHLPGEPYYYAAWGHDSENGLYVLKGKKLIKKKDANPHRAAKMALNSAAKCDSILGHNIGKFDADVSETHMGIKLPAHKIDDSLWPRMLVDPHAPDLKLKPSCERVLGWPADEQEAVFEWLAQHKIVSRHIEKGKVKYGSKDDPPGKYILKAPGNLVAKYGIGDLTRPEALWDHDMKIVRRDGMMEAYEVEKKIAPILLENERQGMRVDVARLEQDSEIYQAARFKVQDWLRKKLRASPGINWDSDPEVADALRKSGQVKVFPKTKTGRDSVSSKRLTKSFFRDPNVYLALVYRNIVDFVLSHNIEPWLEEATHTGGWIHTIWNQVRSDREKGGARSGRITCSGWAAIIKTVTDKNPEYQRVDDEKIRGLIDLPPLPLARVYCLPDEGDSFVHVDYNQQELRALAHYEEGMLAKAYREDPKIDIHQYVTDLILKVTNKQFKRDVIKHVNFRTVYGGGREGLVEHPMLRFDAMYSCRHKGLHREARCDAYRAADEVLNAWGRALPDVVDLSKRLSAMYQRGEPVRTFGGRLYRMKPATVQVGTDSDGNSYQHTRTYEYTALNYLLQPSGADITKRGIIAYHDHPKRRGRMLCTVYDEINVSASKKIAKQEQKILQESMESIKLDVPWRTDGDVRPNWGTKESA